ncbi:MAG: DUF1684 domain-containing protein [Candidatus Latescibacterota bacterium]|nr:MAG: DUF1684 domain-containing protein [Candidatus Latescibacterota bacterium]
MRVSSDTGRRVCGFVAILLCTAVILDCGGSVATDEDTSKYIEEIKSWHQQRIERLKDPKGWLSLAGLHWLEEGENTLGTGSSNDIVLPDGKAPALVGVITLNDGVITINVEAGIQVVHEKRPIQSTTMYHDQDPDHETTVLELGPLSWYAVKRGGRLGIRVKDSESNRLKQFRGIETYEIDPRWRVEGILEPHDPPKMVSITNVLGVESKEPSPGTLVFEIDGTTHKLDPIAEPGDDELFVVFGDRTNGKETYGGGRFVYVDAPGEDGKIVVDFNKAYNPPCALTPYATCPLPPPQNQLPIAVRAGEKVYGNPAHKKTGH